MLIEPPPALQHKEIVDDDGRACELSIVMPCLNEIETIATCISKAQRFLADYDIHGEVLIADNGSTDGSIAAAENQGARVVHVSTKGYGAALMGGIEAARGEYIIMGDCDDSYNFLGLMPYVEALRHGHDLVMGNRFKGGIAPGAMPWLHKYLGNPVLSFVGRLFFKAPIGDFHCGLRGFRRDAIRRLGLTTTGMEFASEMVVKAALRKLRITEVPTTLVPDGRSRPPHLRTWRDGWRHLRFLLTYSPRWLFAYPGLTLLLGGLAGFTWLAPAPRHIGMVELGVHSQLFAAVAALMGLQLCSFAVLARQYGVVVGHWPQGPGLIRFRRLFTLERGLLLGFGLLGLGIALAIWAFTSWAENRYGAMVPDELMRLVIPAAFLCVAGMQSIFTSFFLFLLDVPKSQ